MKKIITLIFTISLFLTACQYKESTEKFDFEELRNNSMEEFYSNYKHNSGKLMEERKLFEDFFYEAKFIHESGLDKGLESYKSKALSVYSKLEIENDLAIKEIHDLKSESYNENRLYFIEYLIINDINKSAWNDEYKFDDMKIGFSHQRSHDSIEISVFPKGLIKWYNPLIIINNDTIAPRNLNYGTGKFKVDNLTDELTLKGKYVMRHNQEKLHFLIDTTIRLNN